MKQICEHTRGFSFNNEDEEPTPFCTKCGETAPTCKRCDGMGAICYPEIGEYIECRCQDDRWDAFNQDIKCLECMDKGCEWC